MADGLEKVRAALAGRYDIERELGAGGMAIVYLARDVTRDRTVAVKVLRPEIAVAMGGDRFLREIKVAGNLHHPNILPVYDSGDAGGVLYFVMPYVTGESLRDRLDREQQLSIDEAVRITREVADGIQHAHNHGIIHRDIKPENVLLEGGHAIVADFGIARAASESGQKLTETGMSVGTPTYMSPEQAAGGERIDGRSDQYSLACMLYEMLSGHPPFVGTNSMAILAKHAMETPPSLQIVRQSIPDEVEDAIMRALEKTPADRFQSISDFADALGDVELATATRRAHRTSGGRPRTSGERRTKPRGMRVEAPRSRKKLIAIGAAALVLLGGGWVAWNAWGTPEVTGVPEEADPKRIAVMYFDTRGGDSLQFLADGLTEALISQLSQVEPLDVISRNGVAALRHAPPDSVARALNVGTLVQGTVAQAGDLLRLTVSMLDADGREIRGSSKSIDRPRSDVFALQDTLASEVAAFLRTRLGEEVEVRESRAGTRNAAAWEALQRAREEAARIDPLIAARDSAAIRRQFGLVDSLFGGAAQLDARWATPHAERAWLAFKRVRLSWSAGDREAGVRWLERGTEHAETAVRLGPNDPDALEARATLVYWRWLLGLELDQTRAEQLLVAAERDYRASIEANPAQASALTSLSHLLINRGRVAEAQVTATTAYEKDPYLEAANVTLWRLFTTSLDLEDEPNARRWCQEGQRRFPADARFIECQIRMFALKSVAPDVPRVWSLLEQYITQSPVETQPFRRLRGQRQVAIALVRAGLKDSALAVIERSRAPDQKLDPTRELDYFEAIAQTLLGNQDRALELLALVVATNPSQRRSFALDQTWWFRDLRTDPRYRTIAGS